MNPRHIAVIDVGKTNIKLALVDSEDMSEVAVVTRPNTVIDQAPYPHFDTDGHWQFVLAGLSGFQSSHGVDAITTTTHGASAVLLCHDGNLAAPVLDYEHTGPDAFADEYNQLRPTFDKTGSPRLPMGLNLGAQLHWQLGTDRTLADKVWKIVTYPQYWGFKLTANAASDVSSLGCHTDLWQPKANEFSSLPEKLGIQGKLAAPIPSNSILGTVTSETARLTGLPGATPVFCGIHDSNASLLPHVLARGGAFSVVSTGTWVVVMTIKGNDVVLDPRRDTLINVNALGDPVPSARFMGGREFDLIMADDSTAPDISAIARTAQSDTFLLPAVVNDCGPFAGMEYRWQPAEPARASEERATALAFYLALESSECLALTGHQGDIIVEGPFARNHAYLAMLTAATGCAVVAVESQTGTSHGAALLALSDYGFHTAGQSEIAFSDELLHALKRYAHRWQAAFEY